MKDCIFKTSVKKYSKQDTQNILYTLWEIDAFTPLRKTELLTSSYPPLQEKLLLVNFVPCCFVLANAITTNTPKPFPINFTQYSTLEFQIGKRLKVLFLFDSKILSFFTIPSLQRWGQQRCSQQTI